jgi:hypothetical protein
MTAITPPEDIERQHHPKTIGMLNKRMSDLSKLYAEKLNAFCLQKGWVSKKDQSKGSPSELVARLGRSSSFWSDRLSGRKPISTDLAYEIEDALQMDRLALAGWAAPDSSEFPLSADLLMVLRRLDGDALIKAENVLRAHLDMDLVARKSQQHVQESLGEKARRYA